MVRTGKNGVCAATNHFRTPGLRIDTECERYDALTAPLDGPLSASAVHKRLRAATQDEKTIQTMVFDPTKQTLHIAIGASPSTDLPLRSLNYRKLLAR